MARVVSAGRRLPELWVELMLAAGVAVVALVGVSTELSYSPHPYPAAAGGYALTVAACLPMVLRRRWPLSASLVMLVAVVAYHQLGYPGLAVAIPAFVATYSLPAYGRRVHAVIGCALVIAAVWLVPTTGASAQSWTSFASIGPAMGLAWMAILGAAARQRRTVAEQRMRDAAETANAVMGKQLAEERLRIARELHDVLAHTVSVISVHAGLALDALDDDVDSARTAMHRVRDAARQAGPELRAAVGVMRDRDPMTPPPTPPPPQPRLDGLADLLATVREAGVRASLDTDLGSEPLPHPVELTAYRIVQESLTNVVRHARASTVDVAVTREGDTLVVHVHDDGTGPARPESPSVTHPGLGILGMRERAQLLGGTVVTGAHTNGGFHVLARIPVQPR